MIPHFPPPSLDLGLVTIHGFGALVAIGIILAFRILEKRAAKLGLDPELSSRMGVWVVVGGFLGAHLVDCFVYNPAITLKNPIRILKVWEGISSFGGFLGAIVAANLLIKKYGLGPERWQYLDNTIYAFPFGWLFGRLGCFVAFDHPGTPTDFFLAQEDARGVVRHNLGLDEALYTLVIITAFILLGRKQRGPGFFAGLICVIYAPFRFMLDYLRAVDVRYFGFTPGQYGAVLLFLLGVSIIYRSSRKMGEDATKDAASRAIG